jgi:hypothetical protein
MVSRSAMRRKLTDYRLLKGPGECGKNQSLESFAIDDSTSAIDQ